MIKTLYHFLFGTLRGRLIIGVALVHAVMMALFIGDLTTRQRAMLLDRQVEEASALSQALATSAAGWITADDISGLQELVEAQRRYPEILFAILADAEGRVLAGSDKSRQGLYMLDLPREARQTVLSQTPALVDIAVPAMIGGRHVGWARVGIGQKAAGEKLAAITRTGVVYALAAILIGSVIAWFMGRRITRRLYIVQETIDSVRSGNRLARSSLAGTDEAAVMAQEFNSMLDALAARDAELSASEERYRSLIYKVQTAIVLHDGHGRILNSNPLAQGLLGLSADQLLGKALIDPAWHFLREDGSVLPVAEYPVNLVLATRLPLRGYVAGIRCPDRANVAWVMVNAEPEYDDAGEVALVIVSFVDITERKRAEQERLSNLRFFERMDQVNRAIQGARDVDSMMSDVLGVVLSIFDCDRAWLFYPCDPDAPSFRVPMEITKPEYPGAKMLNVDLPMPPDMAQNLREALESVGPVTYTAGTEKPINKVSADQFGVKSQMLVALYPKSGKPWAFGLHQCSYPRVWTSEEERLFQETGRRIADALTGLLMQRNLQESESRYRRITEGLTDYQYSVRIENGRAVETKQSTACAMVTGYTSDEFAADPYLWIHMVAPDDRELVRERVQQILAGNETPPIEHRISRKDGTTCWVSDTVVLFKDASGKLLSYDGVIKDITERKLAEDALHRLNRELRAVSSCNQVLVRAEDEQTLLNDICRIICDEAGYRMVWVGYAENDDSKTIRPVAWAGTEDGYLDQARLTWDDTERGRGPSGTAIRSGESTYIQDFTTDPQAALWRDSALQRGYRSSIALPLKDESENTFGVLNIYSTELNAFTAEEKCLLEELSADLAFGIVVLRTRAKRKQVEEALYEAQQVFRTLIENSPDIIARYDRDCRRTYVNPTYLKVAQIPQHELLLSAPLQRSPLPAASAAVLQNLLRRVLGSGVAEAVDVIWPKADNTDYWYNIFAFPEFDREGRVVSVMTISRDITERKLAEQRLQESEKRLRLTLEATRIGIWDWDVKNDRWYASPVYYTMLGYEPQTGLADRNEWMERVHPDDQTHVRKKIQDVLSRDFKEYRYEARMRHADGTYRWQQVMGFGIEREQDGQVTRLLGIRIDINERKQAEEDLRRMNERFSLATNAAHLGVWDWDLQKNKLVWDERMYALYGIKREDFTGAYEAWMKGVHPDDRAVSDEISKLAQRGEREYDTEFRVVWPDGSIHHLKAYGQIVRDADGRPLRMTGINFDITERKQAEKELQKSNDLLRAIIAATPTAVAGLDLDGNVQMVWNPAAEKMLGWSAQEVMGRLLPSVPVESQEEFRRFRERIRSGKTLDGVEVRRQRRDGTPIDYSIYASPLYDAEGRITGNVCVLVDITERKQAEQELWQYREHLEDLVRERTRELHERTLELETANVRLQEADRLKSVFLASMSHELRTPLNSIIGFTGIMLMGMTGKLNEEQRRQLMMVRDSANLLLGLINDVLDIAKIGAGKVTLSPEAFQLEDVVDLVLRTLLPMAAEKGLELVRDIPSGVTLVSDKRRVEQILINIAGNAIKFTDHGSVRISARVLASEKVEFRFTDTGIGIKQEDFSRLFSPFQQIDTSLVKPHEGTGLGLYLCKTLAVLLGGDIGVTSTYGKGSEFTVVLPLSYRRIHEEDSAE